MNRYFGAIDMNKYLPLVPTNESKEIIKNLKNCGVKSETKIGQLLKTQMTLMKNI